MITPLAWINGRIVSLETLSVPYFDLGLVAGAAVTEMARTYRHLPFRLDAHLQRLQTSLHRLKFPQAFTTQQLREAASRITAHNASLITPHEDLGIVIFSTAGSNSTYLGSAEQSATTAIHTFRLPFAMWQSSFQHGARLTIPQVRQIPDSSFPVTFKVRNRLHWWIADQQAAEVEQGSRALLLDQDDCVTETSTSCFFAVIDGTIVTPSRNVLNSLSSQIVEELAHKIQLPFQRRVLRVDELSDASEAFLSSTPSGPIPVYSVNRKPFEEHCPGPVFSRIVDAWIELTGVDIRQQMMNIGVSD